MAEEEAKDDWEKYWASQEDSAAEPASAPAEVIEDTMMTADTMVDSAAPTREEPEYSDTLATLANLKPEKRKKPVKISNFLAWKTGIKNILYEKTDDAQMSRLKEAHKRLIIAFRILAWVSLVALILTLWSITPEGMSVVVFFMLTVLTLGLLFAIGDVMAIMNLSYAGEVLGRYAMWYLIFGTLVLIAVTVVVGIRLHKNEVSVYERYDRIVLKNKTRAYSKEITR